ncbi:MAG TPA: sigma-54 dependent transcriptional regulator [Archangium sp.]|jgi:two-component system nitrogen regulation response regulator GlnG|uniref:sigma-54 dependent transcriptional regulator n=1 Tax=Archangium sp. TaxID=1872627 RepID=UPI002ED825B7
MKQSPSTDLSTTTIQTRSREEDTPHPIPALTVVSHPVSQRVGERLLLGALTAGRKVLLSRSAPDFTRPGSLLALPLGDPFISRKPLVLEPGSGGGVRLYVEGDGMQVRVGDELLRGVRELGPQALAAGVPLVLAERVVLLLHLASSHEGPLPELPSMVGQSEGLRRVKEELARVADLDVPVLIRGETGTGKELVARALHQGSPRRQGPFISVNLGALPRELVIAELFGSQRGAFTGANRDREGLFRAAHGGTLFLDEVGEASPEVQVALLRVLETGEVFPVGSHSPVSVDVRLVTATDANLEARIDEGLFRAPLLHRLAGYEVRLPPLRERREDIGLLFHHFARGELERTGELHRLSSTDPQAEPWLPTALAVRLVRHAWPGNIRQLRNVTRQLVIGSRGLPRLRTDARLEQELDAAALPLPSGTRVDSSTERRVPEVEQEPLPRRKPSEVEEHELLAALRDCSWELQSVADRLGIPRPSVYTLIKRFPHLRTAGDLNPEEIERCFHECRGDLDAMVERLQVSRRALQRRIRELRLGT